jgi:hypothetical protein
VYSVYGQPCFHVCEYKFSLNDNFDLHSLLSKSISVWFEGMYSSKLANLIVLIDSDSV